LKIKKDKQERCRILSKEKALLGNNGYFGTLLIGAEGARLLREYGAGETPQALKAPRRLSATPAESEATGAEISRNV